MDAGLKARNLASAAARRHRIAERQIQQQIIHQQRLARKRDIMTDVQSIEEFDADSESESSSSSSSSNTDVDFTAESPSEASVQTPGNLSSPREFITLSPKIYNAVIEVTGEQEKIDSLDPVVTDTEGVPKMQATLTTIADWNYDRFSIFMGSSDDEGELQENTEESEGTSSSSDDELDERSPIETATTITYTVPRTKPSLVSVLPPLPVKPLNIVKNRPTYRRHVSEQMVSGTTHGGPGSGEFRSFHAYNTSRDTLVSSNGSSQVSRSVSLASQKDSLLSRSVSQTSQSDQSMRSPKRKSSMPLLFGANKTGHSRMSSIKKFIRSSTLGPPAPSQRSLSGSTLETHFEDRVASMELTRESVVEEVKRPMTAAVQAHTPAFSSMSNVPPLPTLAPPPVPTEPPSRLSEAVREESKPKPTLKFRSRSGSIGQALKSIGSGPKKADPSAPPVPAISIPRPSMDLEGFPAPPPLTPRNPRRSANYSPFPNPERKSPTFPLDSSLTDRRASPPNVGLGLRY